MIPATEAILPLSIWAAGNGEPMHGVCILYSIPRAWEQQT